MRENKIWFEEIEIDKLETILISAKNPRFEEIESIKDNLCKILTEDLDKNNQEKVAEKLLEREGDLSQLLDLIDSIEKNNFKSSSEIILLKSNNENYIVAEGNRRILCLKIFFNIIKFPKLIFFENNNNMYEKLKNQEYNNQKKDLKIKIIKNYAKINEKIKIIQKNISDFKIKNRFFRAVIVQNDNEYLWEKIYDKHVNGEAVGFKKWSRGQYFLNLLNYFKNGINLTAKEKWEYESKLSKKEKIIRSDYKHAQLSYKIAESDTEKNLDLTKEFMVKSQVSALQENFWNGILKLVLKDFGINWEDKKDKFIKIDYDKKTSKINEEKSIFKNTFLKFIKRWFLKKLLTTRKNFSDHPEYELFIDELSKLLKIEIDSEVSKEHRNNLQILKSDTKIWVPELIKIMTKFQKWNFSKKFLDLLNQLEHNSGLKFYTHAFACTIRTIMEFLIIFNVASIEDDQMKKFQFLFENIFSKKNKKLLDEKGITKLQDRLIFCLFQRDYRTDNLMKKFDVNKKNKYLKHLGKLKNIFGILITNQKISDDLWSFWKEKKKLNNIIHRLMYDKSSIGFLMNINAKIKELIKALDYDKLKKLYEKIEEQEINAYIDSKNQEKIIKHDQIEAQI